MPRLPRLLLSRSFYHIIARGNNRQIVFRNPKDYQYYLALLRKYKAHHPFELYHYCLMPNHIHFLIKTKSAQDFAEFMKKVNLAYFQHYKKQHDWVGHLWQGRYRSQPVGKDEYFIQCGKYIELNPIRAKIVGQPKNYQYSSYRHYALDEYQELITPDLFYAGMGRNNKERQRNYREMIINDVVINNYNQKIWGSNPQQYNEQQKIRRRIKTKN